MKTRPSPTILRARTAPPVSFAAALMAALIGFGGTVALIVQAGEVIGASPTQIGSSVTALCLGIAIAGAALSFLLRMPVVLAWSTPGAALVATNTLGLTFPVALGAFVAAAVMMISLGLVPALGRLASRIPTSVAAAMLAGVLLPFCLTLFRTFESDGLLAGVLLVTYVLARQRFPTYALLAVLMLAISVVVIRGEVTSLNTNSLFGTLTPTQPVFTWQAVISLGLPLFLVTLVSQNLPGFAVLRSAGYNPPPRLVLLVTGLTTLLLAPFGAHGVNLAAITAALCTGKEAHPEPARRWIVGMIYAGLYLLLALFSAPLVGLFMAMPSGTVAAITGVALIGPLINALGGMFDVPEEREAAVLTFAATASGVAVLGIGSAFWGVGVGLLALAARRVLSQWPSITPR